MQLVVSVPKFWPCFLPWAPSDGGAAWQLVQLVSAGSLPQAGLGNSKWQFTLLHEPSAGLLVWGQAVVMLL